MSPIGWEQRERWGGGGGGGGGANSFSNIITTGCNSRP